MKVKPGLIIFDLETSITAPIAVLNKKPPIISIAALAIDFDFQPLEWFEKRIKFRMDRADKTILNLIYYSDEKWEKAEHPLQVAKEFLLFLQKYMWLERTTKAIYKKYQSTIAVGHNIKHFDLPVLFNWYAALNELYPTAKLQLPLGFTPTLDTLQLAEIWSLKNADYPPSYRLPHLCYHYGLEVKEHHENILMTLELLKHFSPLLDKEV